MVGLRQKACDIEHEGIAGGVGVVDGGERGAFVVAALRTGDGDVTDGDYSEGVRAEGRRPERCGGYAGGRSESGCQQHQQQQCCENSMLAHSGTDDRLMFSLGLAFKQSQYSWPCLMPCPQAPSSRSS